MKKENSLKINSAKEKLKNFPGLLPGAAAVFAAAAGFSAMLFGAVSSPGLSPFLGVATGIAAAAFVLLSDKKIGRYIPFAVSAVCVLAVLIYPPFRNGLLVLGNEACEILTFATGKIHLGFEIPGEAFAEGALFLAALALCGILSTAVCEKSFVPAAAVLVLTAAGIFVGILSTDIWFLVFMGGITGIALWVFAPKNGAKASAKSALSGFAGPVLCGLICFVLVIFIPAAAGENIRAAAEKTLHSVFYDSKTNAMPEGDFNNLGGFERSEEPALEITAEKPQKLYLKGFVGEVYSGYGWESLSNDVLGAYAEEFYLLHENGFFGQKSVSSALSCAFENEEAVLSIRNISACSKRAYLPYALSGAVLNDAAIGDANTESFGESCSVSYIPGGLAEWYLAQVRLAENQGKDKAVDEHLANEYIYRGFVKDNYLSVPKEAFETLEKIFADSDASTATEIISEILIYLDENVTYDEEFSSNGGTDFVSFFLEKSARGYSVHYASAAALMLRYFGIPARYVEGYFLSAEEAAEYESGEIIILTENHAHAWAEYYLEGVGWVPFEVTPGYKDDELEKAAFSTSGESSKRYEQSELPETNVDQDRPKDDITEAKKDYTLIIAVSVVVPVLALLAAAVYIAAMRKRLKKALSAITKADNKTGAAMRFGYAEKLLENVELSAETVESLGYGEAFAVNREALFSGHSITDEQRRKVDDYAEKVLAECKKSWSLRQKIKNKWIKFIY